MKRVNKDMDLKLALGYSKRGVQKRMNNDTGAGVNAGSGLHIFTASDPLSELVWSPQKGVSLKCADNSLANNKPFLVWNVAPSNDHSSPSEIIRFSSVNDEQETDKGSTYGMENGKPADVVGGVDANQNKENLWMNEENDFPIIHSVRMTSKDEGGENHAGYSSMVPKFDPSMTKPAGLECGEEKAEPPLQKTEFTAENYIKNSTIKEANLLRLNSLPIEASSTRIRACSRKRKGKEKAYSDGDNGNSRMSGNEEDSHESVESCNSSRMFHQGKKLDSVEETLSLGSKRIKKELQIDAAPTPNAGDSSFMTWISSMVTGFSKPCEEEVPSLALALTPSGLGHVGNHFEIPTSDKNHNTMFHSLYCPTLAMPEKRTAKDDLSAGESKDVLLDNKMIIEVSPITCHRENDGLDEQILRSNDKTNTTDMEGVSPKSNSAENKVCGSKACSKEKIGGSSSGSMFMLRTGNGENSSPSHHSENKAIRNASDISSLRSFWITRFSARDPSTALNLADRGENRDETANNCAKSDPNAQINSEFFIYNKGSEAKGSLAEDPGYDMLKDMSCNALDDDASIAFKEDHDNKPIHKLNPITPSPNLKSSEAMTSLFAKRLDAFKHIIPPNARNEATCTRAICLFCGRSGHDLHNCSDADESEQEDLLRNVCSNDLAEGSHSFCIRCLKLDHWAVTCPMASSGGQYLGKNGNCCFNRNSTSNLHLYSGDASGPNFLGKEEGCSNVNVNHIAGSKEKSRFFTDTNNLVQHPKSSVPKGAFDAIRRLRLSRGDILRWLNSNASLSHLDGFFLRLRLGRWEGGLGGTGYYIARIAESQRDHSAKDSKCISVSICGIICSVGSQYVSNHDFLEDELMTWWCRTSETGGKIPSEDELRMKVEERMKLCL